MTTPTITLPATSMAPAVATTTATGTEAAAGGSALLRLMWLASPALPVGGFSYSEGLEAAVDHGHVRDEASAAGWLADQLALTLARCDLPVLAQALAAWQCDDLPRVRELNAWLLSTRETAELRLQTEQMGRSLVAWLGAVQPDVATRAKSAVAAGDGTDAGTGTGTGTSADLSWPVAFALAAADSGASARDVLRACAFGWAENMMQASIKAVPLGQSAGQRILKRLLPDIEAAVDHALRLDSDAARQSFSPGLAILSARHETQYSRLFRS